MWLFCYYKHKSFMQCPCPWHYDLLYTLCCHNARRLFSSSCTHAFIWISRFRDKLVGIYKKNPAKNPLLMRLNQRVLMKNSIVLYYYTELSANTLYITTYTNIIYIRHIHIYIHLTSKPVFCLQKV